MRYRTKDREVEAMQLTSRDPEGLVAFCGGTPHAWSQIYGEMMNVYVDIGQGACLLDAGDWVIKDKDGTLSMMGNKAFHVLYDKVAADE